MAYQLNTNDLDDPGSHPSYQLTSSDIDNLSTPQSLPANAFGAIPQINNQQYQQGQQQQMSDLGNWFETPHPNLAKAVLGGAIAAPVELGVGSGLAGLGLADELGAPSLLARLLANSSGGAASTIPTGTSPLGGAVVGGGLGALGEGFNTLTAPGNVAKFLGGNATPEQVAANQSLAPAGVNLPAGKIISSPSLQSSYSMLGLVPFSGAAKPYEGLNNFFSNALDTLNPASKSIVNPDFDQIASNDMTRQYLAQKGIVGFNYSNYNNEANNLGQINFNTNAFDQANQNASSEIQNNIPKMNNGSLNPSIQKQYGPISDFISDYKNTPITDFNTAMNLDKGITNQMGLMSDDPVAMRYLTQMKSGLAQSMDDTASQYPSIDGLYQQAKQSRVAQGSFEQNPDGSTTQFFKNFNNPSVNSSNNFISKSLPITAGKNNTDLISNFMSNLSPEGQDAVRASILTPKPNSTNPIGDQVSKISLLQPSELQAMFGEQAPLAQQVQGLANMYPAGKSPGTIPLTGFSGSKIGAIMAAILHPPLATLAPVAAGARSLMNSDLFPNMYLKSLQNASDSTASGTGILGPLMRNASLQSTLSALPNQSNTGTNQ